MLFDGCQNQECDHRNTLNQHNCSEHGGFAKEKCNKYMTMSDKIEAEKADKLFRENLSGVKPETN